MLVAWGIVLVPVRNDAPGRRRDRGSSARRSWSGDATEHGHVCWLRPVTIAVSGMATVVASCCRADMLVMRMCSAGGESAEKVSASEHKQWLGALEHGRYSSYSRAVAAAEHAALALCKKDAGTMS